MHASFSAALRALVPDPALDESAYPPAFRRMAELLLNGVTVMISGEPHRFTEIEVYWNGAAHPDSFTHGDAMQRELGRWYFHRSGEEYRGGTYKGLDIAVGREDVHAGLLIRGLERQDGSPPIDGPCMCADHILARTGQPSVRSLVASFDRSVDDAPGSPLYVRLDEPRPGPIHAGARVGLTLKRGIPAERARFLARPYRFVREPAKIKKGRLHIALGMHRDGLAPADIARLTGSSLAQVQRYIAQFESGKDRELADFIKNLSADETCQLLGACERFMR